MNKTNILREIFVLRWKPSIDLAAVAASWILLVGALYTATVIVGQEVWGGMAYFILYAIIGATLFGVGFPLFWMIVIRRRTLADLGLTTLHWAPSIAIQILFAVIQFANTLAKNTLPPFLQLLPLLALALAIGFFEAVFWRGWVLLRLEESFGIIPGILAGSLLYALYHIGYGMLTNEMVFLFFIGILFAVIFRLTKNILILWPVFQPMGQLVTLIRDGLSLPPLAALGFIEALIGMFILVWLAGRHEKKLRNKPAV